MATFFFFFFELGVKLDEESIGDGLEAQKNLENKDLSVECLLWGSCHCPNLLLRPYYYYYDPTPIHKSYDRIGA